MTLVENRLDVMERTLRERDDHRVADIQHFTEKLGDVHEKVNTVALSLAGLNGKLVVFGLVTTGAGAIVMFMLNALWTHSTK